MVFYRLPLVLLTCLTCSGFLDRPSASVMSKNYTDLQPPVFSDEPTSSLILAQENSTAEKPKFQFPPQLPMGLILLGVGSIIVTGGAVFIMIKLISNKPEIEAEEQLPPDHTVEESSPYFVQSENALIPPSPASPFRVEDADEPPEISSKPTVEPADKPAEKNG